MKTRSTIYIEPSAWKEFKQICNREGESMCEKIESWILQYNDRHRKGNPQLRIDYTLRLINQQKCGRDDCDFPAVGRAEAKTGWKGFLCADHYEQSRNARLLRKWKEI